MKLLLWSCLLCLACNNVCGMFLELPDNPAESTDDSTGDDFIGKAISGISQHFSIQDGTTSPKPPSQHKDSNNAGATTSTGFLNEMEASLEHATDTLDEIWQQFRKGVLSLVGDSDNDDSKDTDRRNVTLTNSLQQLQTTTNSMLAKVTSTVFIPTTTTIVTTTTLLTATTTMQPPQL